MAVWWILEGVLPLTLLVAAQRLRRLWHTTRARVMNYPGPYAVATYLALEAMRWVVALGLVMVAAVSLGWGGLATAALVIAMILQLVAMCSVGLMLPMIAVVPARRRDSAQPG
jgi:uncharacterized membrane protein YtjA (UPF0391 family)